MSLMDVANSYLIGFTLINPEKICFPSLDTPTYPSLNEAVAPIIYKIG